MGQAFCLFLREFADSGFFIGFRLRSLVSVQKLRAFGAGAPCTVSDVLWRCSSGKCSTSLETLISWDLLLNSTPIRCNWVNPKDQLWLEALPARCNWGNPKDQHWLRSPTCCNWGVPKDQHWFAVPSSS